MRNAVLCTLRLFAAACARRYYAVLTLAMLVVFESMVVKQVRLRRVPLFSVVDAPPVLLLA